MGQRSRMPAAGLRTPSLAGMVLLLGALTACSGSSGGGRKTELTLVSYAVTQSAYSRIIPKFVADWKAKTGETVSINQSYGGSGSQARAVIDGLEADVVALALEPDISRIEKAGLIQPGWQKDAPNNATVTRSVAVLVTRPGNPKQVQDWADLGRPGLQVVTANPKTSGGARWNFLGLWGSVTRTGGSPAQAEAFVTRVYRNVPVLPKDAREATDIFAKQGQGDVLINYENEVLLARANGQSVDYVIPAVNVSIDAPVAVVDRNVDRHGARKVAEAFVNFLFTPAAQEEFAKAGFRPVLPELEQRYRTQFPVVKTLFTAQELGGWPSIQKQFFADGALFDRILATK
jgi:sulfate/thiosulfate transport system substrate-binding protein